MHVKNRTIVDVCMRLSTTLALALAAQVACANPPSICVTNNTELASALVVAKTTAVSIELMQSTYDLKNTVWNLKTTPSAAPTFKGGSSLLGGYTSAGCSSRNVDINNTIITDSTSAPSDGFNILGDATIEGITFKLSGGLLVNADKDANGALDASSQLTFRRNVFTQGSVATKHPVEVDWNETIATAGTVRLVNNLLHDNTSSGGPSNSAAIFVLVNGGKPTIELINNTVVDNSGSLGGFGLLNLSDVPVYAYNNIFHGNAGTDFAVFFGSDNTLIDNVIGTHSYAGTLSASGNTTGDPKLDANFKPIEAPPSPVINSGTGSVIGGLPTTDLPGRARTIGSVPDRGAYESSISDAVTQMVTNTNDSGPGSLRSAILSANASSNYTTISFSLGSTCGPSVITPVTALPNITSSLQILGATQPGSSVNDLDTGDDAVICVVLDGSPNHLLDGLMVPTGVDDTVNVNIEALAFSGFSHSAASFYGGSAHRVQGVHIGGNVGNVGLDPVGNGIVIGPGVHGVTIGGDPTVNSVRNIIGAASGVGISIDGAAGTSLGAANNNTIQNNYIGIGWSISAHDFTDRGNGGVGIIVAGYRNQIYNNVIDYNADYGVELTGANSYYNDLQLNVIGVEPASPFLAASNLGGVINENDAHDNTVFYNSIELNTTAGVRIVNGQGNAIYGNTMFGNGGLGIDLAAVGVTPNDNDTSAQAAGYANRGQNFPVITGAIGGHTNGTFSGTLTTAPGNYIVELFLSASCNSSGYGEGLPTYVGLQVATSGPLTNGQATATFSIQNDVKFPLTSYHFVTMTAMDVSNNTSEFSKCFTYVDDTLFADSFELSQ
jgi:Periplasmic copper-binding protein (NosD)